MNDPFWRSVGVALAVLCMGLLGTWFAENLAVLPG